MGFIDYGKLEDVIKDIEGVFEAHGLKADEKEFTVKQILIRIKKQQDKQRMSDMISNNMSGGMLKGLANKMMGKDEGSQ